MHQADQPSNAPSPSSPEEPSAAGSVAAADPYAAYPGDAQGGVRWHIVFGWIGLAYGALGTLFAGLALVLTLAAGPLERWTGRPVGAPKEMFWMNLGQSSVTLGLGVLLVVGSLGLIRRRARGARLVLSWAAARLAFCVVQLVLGFVFIDTTAHAQVAQYERQMASMGEAERAQAEKAMASFGIAPPTVEGIKQSAPKWLALSVIGFAVWPLITGLALTGRRARADVAEWRREQEAHRP